ncbi:MAG: hypothetical protein A3K19_30145 [Lentisphaerae bacterium RIFOXYB12_FULL_65_16]|nr:MAG: hypothetical protein A3K18_18860 [Lentisphaerae bacterium RIFOXYA12_64_32]OGV85761.1 MAG: hypothetical protein A3K19_30145 [Lentisphaerae bacterium RIFOXYB12_FULL_65_16]
MRFTHRWYVRYSLALAIVVGAVLARAALVPVMGLNVPYVTIYPAIMIVAVVLGAGPGVFAAVVGLWLAERYFMRPGTGIDWNLSLAIRSAILLGASLYLGWIGHRLRAARARAEAEAAVARAAEAALRRQVELIDPARAEIIVREMQRVVRERGSAVVPPSEPVAQELRRLPTVAGAAVAATGLLVLAGWSLGIDGLTRILPGAASMKVNTALCLLVAGGALALRERRVWRLAGAAAVGAIGALSLAEYVTVTGFGIDELMFHDPGDAQTIPGRMAQITAVCFMLTSLSLLLAGARTRAALWTQQAASVAVGILGLMAALGYAYDVRQLYGPAGFSSMALPTAAAFVALASGLLFARSDGLTEVLMAPGPGGQLVRRLLPAAIFLPLVLGWLHEAGERIGLFGPSVGACLFALAMMVALAALVWWTAAILNRADAARRETEIQLRNQAELMDHAREALIVRDLDGAIRFWNHGAAALYGWPAAEALGQRIHVLLRTSGLPPDYEVRLVQAGHWEGEMIHTTRDGRRVTVETRKTALRAADGHMLVLESNRDVTERKQAEQDLRRVNENLDQFAYVASHDLQEPLRTLSSFSQLIAKRYQGRLDQDADEFIGFILDAAARMQRLITDLLEYSRAGQKHVARVDVDCDRVVRHVIRSMTAALESAGGMVTHDALPTVRAYESGIAQLFQNLIGNALKFRGAAAPRVRVSARQADGEWIFAVSDNGIGIDPQYHQRIFAVFQRLHPRDKYEGSGVGLSICKRIVENLGGRIWVDSAPDRGATFCFTVPGAAENPQPGGTESVKRNEHPPDRDPADRR